MPEPAESNELDELRRLLVRTEIEQLANLEERVARLARLTDPARFEKNFSNSVRRKPTELVDAIAPIMVPAIRNSIAAALREFAEALNQIVEKSVSFRGLRWRVESIVTGKPFGEIVLARSLLYGVEQVFLIHRGTGVLLHQVASRGQC